MFFPKIDNGSQHKFVKQLKKYLNELVQPNPNLPEDDFFDYITQKAVINFKVQWRVRLKVGNYSELTGKGDSSVFTWALIGLALGTDRLKRELPEIKDYELRTLLLGMDALANEVLYYTPEMESCDAKIASVLGGDNAIAAANGFEPTGIALLRAFPFYRGDTRNTWANGTTVIGQGHLSRYIMHLYGSKDNTRIGVDGRTYTDILIPDGFEIKKNTLKQQPTPTQAVVIFYYKKLGNVQDATLLLMHVKDFKPVKRGNRWHIGQIGGKGGEVSENTVTPYLHSHFVLLKGDVGLAIKYKRDGKIDGTATDEYRASIGIKFVDAFC